MNKEHIFVGQLKTDQCLRVLPARVADAFGATFCMVWENVKGNAWGFLIFFENPMDQWACEECTQTEKWKLLLPACTLKTQSLFSFDGGQVRNIWLQNLISNPAEMSTHGPVPFGNRVMMELLFSIQNKIIALLTDQVNGKQEDMFCEVGADEDDFLDLAD